MTLPVYGSFSSSFYSVHACGIGVVVVDHGALGIGKSPVCIKKHAPLCPLHSFIHSRFAHIFFVRVRAAGDRCAKRLIICYIMHTGTDHYQILRSRTYPTNDTVVCYLILLVCPSAYYIQSAEKGGEWEQDSRKTNTNMKKNKLAIVLLIIYTIRTPVRYKLPLCRTWYTYIL